MLDTLPASTPAPPWPPSSIMWLGPPEKDAPKAVDAPKGGSAGVADPVPPPRPVAICQNMKSDGATANPDLYYKLAHVWAEKWKEADKDKREIVVVDPAAATTNAMDEAAIKKLAATMITHFTKACQTAQGTTIYMALSHGGAELLPADAGKIPTRVAQLAADKQALADFKKTIDKKALNYKELIAYVEEEQMRIDVEDARVNRAHWPTFSLGAQKGGLHLQHLAMDFEYFIYLDYPNAKWEPVEKKCYEARKAYFSDLKALFQKHKIKTLHLIACNIGKDSAFITRVGKELGVGVVAYAYYTVVKTGTGFIGLSSDHVKDDIANATSVEPPLSPVVTG